MKFSYDKENQKKFLIKKFIDSIDTAHDRECLVNFVEKTTDKIDVLLYKRNIRHIKNMLRLLDAIVNSKNIDDDPSLEQDLNISLAKPLKDRGDSFDHIEGIANSLVFLAHILRRHGDQFKELFDGFDESKVELHMKIMAVILEKHLAQINVDLENAKRNEMIKKVGRPFMFQQRTSYSTGKTAGEKTGSDFEKTGLSS